MPLIPTNPSAAGGGAKYAGAYSGIESLDVLGIAKWSDGSYNTHGVLFPTSVTEDAQFAIDSVITKITDIATFDDLIYSNLEEKNFVADSNFDLKYQRLDSIKINAGSGRYAAGEPGFFTSAWDGHLGANTFGDGKVLNLSLESSIVYASSFTTDTGGNMTHVETANYVAALSLSTDNRHVNIADGRNLVFANNANEIVLVDDTAGSLQFTTATLVDPTGASVGVGYQDILKLDSTRALCTFHDAVDDKFYAVVATIGQNSVSLGTTVDVTGAVATSTASSGITTCLIDTDKALIFYVDSSSSTTYATACTIAGTVITAGNRTQVGASGANFDSTAGQSVSYDTDKAILMPSPARAFVSVSGLVVTVDSVQTDVESLFEAYSAIKTATNEFMAIVGNAAKRFSVSGTTVSLIESRDLETIDLDGTTVDCGYAVPNSAYIFQANSSSLFMAMGRSTTTANYDKALGTAFFFDGSETYNGQVTITIGGVEVATDQKFWGGEPITLNADVAATEIYLSIKNTIGFTQSYSIESAITKIS